MKKYRVYEAYRNEVGGVEGCGTGWKYIEAKTALDAAKQFWGAGCGANESTVIVATDDDGDSEHFSPLG